MRRLTLVNISDGFEKGIMPLGLISIATYLKKYANISDITLLDANCQNIYRDMRPTDVVGISSVTQDIPKAIHFAKFVKKKYNLPVILGGVHISTYRKLADSCFDIGVVGEGEQTMLELMKLDTFTSDSLRMIDGICYGQDGKLEFSRSRELINPLDEIPIPDRDIAHVEFYLRNRQIIPYYYGRSMTMLTSRGCPFNCSFCSTRVHWKKYRGFSAKRVLEEIELLVEKYHVEIIHIFDDLFIADRSRLVSIHDGLIKTGINKKVKFMCLVRSDLLNDDTMKMLKAMNVVVTGIGMESGSQKNLSNLKTNTTTLQNNHAAIELSNKYKIPVMGSFMLGVPQETEQEMFETLEFIKKYRNSLYFVPLVYIATPFPGTMFWDYAKLKGIDVENFDNFVMDIPRSLHGLKDAPLLTDVPRAKFFEIARAFLREMSYGVIKRHVFLPRGVISILKAYILGIITQKSIFKGIRQVNKFKRLKQKCDRVA